MGCAGSVERSALADRYRLRKRIDSSSPDEVYSAVDIANDNECVVKVVRVAAKGKAAAELAREIDCWRRVGKHPHCLQLLDAFVEPGVGFLVTDHWQRCLVAAEVPLMERRDLLRTFREMLKGLSRVHQARLVHRDVKPDSFCFGGADGTALMLRDFSLATRLPPGNLLRNLCGDAPFMSPEMIGSAGYGQATDVWSFGVSVHYMLCGEFPYVPDGRSLLAYKRAILENRPELDFDRMVQGFCVRRASEGLDQVSGVGEFAEALLRRCPAIRCTAQEALRLPLLSSEVKLDSLAAKDVKPPVPRL